MKRVGIFILLVFFIHWTEQALAYSGKRKPGENQVECVRKDARLRSHTVPPAVKRAPQPPAVMALPQSQPANATPARPAVAPSSKPASPAVVTNCDPGGCWGSAGNRYTGGTGNVYLDSNGKSCQRVGTWMQCN